MNDYFMRSRLSEYETLIVKSKQKGFEHLTVSEWHRALISGTLPKKVIIHRHDIDTDIRTARKMHKVEQKQGVNSTFYFRLSTLDARLIREIDASSSEVGYHFEEVAQFCKDNGVKEAVVANDSMGKIREIFETNLQGLRERFDCEFSSVAAHGDFVNRKLKLPSTLLLNEDLKQQLNILCEGYDDHLMASADIYIRDMQYPVFYSPVSFLEALDKNNVIYFTTHPRQWETNVLVNTWDNLKRLFEGIRWAM
ncbi:MAG: hypothetical protein MK096_13555 [Oleiphilaceae bacterium]|nr:hypothetical protein [Oleiphilaceae bacterium]